MCHEDESLRCIIIGRFAPQIVSDVKTGKWKKTCSLIVTLVFLHCALFVVTFLFYIAFLFFVYILAVSLDCMSSQHYIPTQAMTWGFEIFIFRKYSSRCTLKTDTCPVIVLHMNSALINCCSSNFNNTPNGTYYFSVRTIISSCPVTYVCFYNVRAGMN